MEDGKPERLSGLEIDHELELCRLQDRQVSRLRALENACRRRSRPDDTPRQGWAIAHQAAGDDVTHERCTSSRSAKRSASVDELVAAGPEERIRPEQERAICRRDKFGECRVNFALGTGIQDDKFHAQSLRRRVHLRFRPLKAGARWIGEETRQMWQQGHQFTQ